MKSLLSILALSIACSPLWATNVVCVNSSTDRTNIQSAVNSGGTVNLSGICNFSAGGINVNNAVDIEGSGSYAVSYNANGWPVYNYTMGVNIQGPGPNSGAVYAFNINSDHVTINGVAAGNGIGFATFSAYTANYEVITNNYMHDTRNLVQGALIANGILAFSNISYNTVYNIARNDMTTWTNTCNIPVTSGYYWPGCASPPPGTVQCGTGSSCLPPSGSTGFTLSQGLNQTSVNGNYFNYTELDGIYMSAQYIGVDSYFPGTATNISIRNNLLYNIHRAGLEFQGTGHFPTCDVPGGGEVDCDFNKQWFNPIFVNGNVVGPAYFVSAFNYCYSLPFDHVLTGQYSNDSCINAIQTTTNFQQSIMGDFIEFGGATILGQGNVESGNPWAASPYNYSVGGITYTSNSIPGGYGLYTTQNSYLCSDNGANFGTEPGGAVSSSLNQYNFLRPTTPFGGGGSQCNGYPTYASNITGSYLSNSTTSGITTFNFGVVSVYAITGVTYTVDGVSVGSQEIGDLNTAFSSTAQWLYHVNINKANYTAASHTVVATFTDGILKTGTASTTFTGGGTAAPAVSFSPSNLAFGSSSGTLSTTLTNTGTAALMITSETITGTNAGDWSVGSTTCPIGSSSLAAGANCTLAVAFSGGTGLLTAALSLNGTNATPTAQTVPLTGGTQAVTLSPGSLSFPSTIIGQPSATQTITLSNVTGSTITGVAVTITGTNVGDYSQTNNCPSSVVSSGTCAIVVTFTPTAAGTRVATVSVADSATGSPQTANLSGLAPPAGLVPPGLYYIQNNSAGSYCFDDGFWANVDTSNNGEIYSCNQTTYQQFVLGIDGSYFQVCATVLPSAGGNPCFADNGFASPVYNGTSGVNDTWTVNSTGYIQNVTTGRYIVPPATPSNDAPLLLSGTPYAWTLHAIGGGGTPITLTPLQPIATAGQSITLTSNTPVVWTLTGAGTCTSGCTGSPTTSIVYTAPSAIEPTTSILGCPVLPNDSVFSTRADNLPTNANNATWLANMTASHIQIQPSWGITYADGNTPIQSWQPYYGNGSPTNSYGQQYGFPWPGRTSPSLKREGGAYVGVTGFSNTPDHHTVVVRQSDCTFYDSYDDRVNGETFTCADSTTAGCNVNSLDYYGLTGATFPGFTGGPYAMPYESTDAAGLPLAPLSWNLQEIKSGTIKHAIRMTVDAASHFGFIWPATTGTGSTTSAPPYGARLVMNTLANGGPNISTICSTNADCTTMLTALLQYGAFLADAGTNEGVQTFSELSQDPTTLLAMKLINNANIPLSDFYFVNNLAMEQTGGHGYTTFLNGSYAADPANGYETAVNSAFFTLTPSTGAVIKIPIALQGTAVGIRETELAIAAGSTYQLAPWVNPSSAAQTVTWACATCASGSSVTSGGLYTATSSAAPAIDVLTGTAAADSSATITVYMQVLTVASGSKILIDTGATSPTSDGTNTWNADANISGLTVPAAGCNTTDSHTWGGGLSVQYESGCYAQNDIFYHVVVPPGNYDVIFGLGQIYNGTTFPAGTIPQSLQFQDNPGFFEAQGVLGGNYYDWNWQTGYLWGSPNTVTIPATVGASGLLEIRAGVNTQDTAITGASGIAPLYNGASAYLAPPNNKLATLQWLQIVPDASSPKITIDSQGASIVSPTQAIQLYAIPWFVAPSAVTWSLISGPGQASVSSTGLVSLSGATMFAGTPVVVQATMGGLSAAITLYSSGNTFLIN